MSKLLILFAIVLASFSSVAHPGHSLFEGAPSHVLTSPFHLLTLIACGATFIVAARLIRHTGVRWIVQCLVVGLAILTLALS